MLIKIICNLSRVSWAYMNLYVYSENHPVIMSTSSVTEVLLQMADVLHPIVLFFYMIEVI